LQDLRGRQLAVMTVFAVAMLWHGVAPQPVLRRMELASTALVERVRGADTRFTGTTSPASTDSTPLTLGAVAP
jgi:NADH:ubiquinone oxidoreductase subunit 4 (subunit M)